MEEVSIKYEECGCCGHYHRPEFRGDCRDDSNRFSLDQIEAMEGFHYMDTVWTLEGQMDAEAHENENME